MSDDCDHEPDWKTVIVTSDGGDTYVDVTCSKCGESGCVGLSKTLEENISWEGE